MGRIACALVFSVLMSIYVYLEYLGHGWNNWLTAAAVLALLGALE